MQTLVNIPREELMCGENTNGNFSRSSVARLAVSFHKVTLCDSITPMNLSSSVEGYWGKFKNDEQEG